MGTAMGSMARRRRAKRRAAISTTALVVGILGIGAAIGGLVYAANRFVDDVGTFPDLDLTLPGPEAETNFSPAAMDGRAPIWSTPTDAHLRSAPVVADNRVSCATSRATSVRSMRRPEARSGTS